MKLVVEAEWEDVPTSPHAPEGSELRRLSIGGYTANISRVVTTEPAPADERWDWSVVRDFHHIIAQGSSFTLNNAKDRTEAVIVKDNQEPAE